MSTDIRTTSFADRLGNVSRAWVVRITVLIAVFAAAIAMAAFRGSNAAIALIGLSLFVFGLVEVLYVPHGDRAQNRNA